MPYMLLVVEPPDQRLGRTEAQGKAAYDGMLQFGNDLKKRGLLLATESLTSEATRVEVRQGQTRFSDGPFAEAKELIGGFFLLDCRSREEAVRIAAECPAAQWCTIEVRALGPCYE